MRTRSLRDDSSQLTVMNLAQCWLANNICSRLPVAEYAVQAGFLMRAIEYRGLEKYKVRIGYELPNNTETRIEYCNRKQMCHLKTRCESSNEKGF